MPNWDGVVVHPYSIVELCAGVGMLGLGTKLGLSTLGVRSRAVCYVERDAYAASTLLARMEDTALDRAPIYSDVAAFDGRPWRRRVDLVVAGIPCQGNSTAGLRRLGKDPRNLWPATRRILREMEPSWFLLENVYGFCVPNRREQLEAPIARVLGELAEDGWDAEWDVVPASEVGASHHRERVFILARNSRLAHTRRGQLPLSLGCQDRGTRLGEDGHPMAKPQALADPLCDEQHDRPDGDAIDAEPAERTSKHAGPRVDSLPLFAPGPSAFGAWATALLLDSALAPAVESPVHGVADGMAEGVGERMRPTRPDEVRAVGNGVCPLAAGLAVARLFDRYAAGDVSASTPTPAAACSRRRGRRS